MKRLMKWVAIVLLVIIAAAGGFAAYVAIRGIPTFEPHVVEFKVISSPERVAHGRNLAMMLCVHCHTDPITRQLTGTKLLDLPVEFGTAYSKNITQDKEHGIGNWSNSEIVYLLRTGIHPKTGKFVPPWMPKFPRVSDEDMASIISFLRSDDPIVAAQPVVNKESEPTFLAKFLCYVAFKPLDYPSAPIPVPDTTNKVAYGKYLAVGLLDCWTCHSGDFKKMDMVNPEKSFEFYAGGNEMLDANGHIVPTTNLTSDTRHGIGAWKEADFVLAMRTGIKPDGTPMRFPMVRLPQLSDYAISSIFAYLLTTPAIPKPNQAPPAYTIATNASAGMKAYYKFSCQRCHGESGLGIADLQLASKKYVADTTLIDVMKHPSKYWPDTYMPEWEATVSDQEYADLAVYVRELGMKSKR
ncbi:cytochrome c [soil metagenome]